MGKTQFNKYHYIVCRMSSDLFTLACRRGYDSYDFIEKLMNSECGDLLYRLNSCQMWLGDTYVLSELLEEVNIKKGKAINEDIMSWIGYLFRYWSIAYPEDTAKDIFKQAGLDNLLAAYNGLHTIYWDEAIERIKEANEEKNKTY